MNFNQTKFLNDEEFIHFHQLVERFYQDAPEKSLMLQLLSATGARVEELLLINREDIFPKTKSIFIRGAKGSYDREIPIEPVLFKRLERHLSITPHYVVFTVTYFQLRRYWKDLWPHGSKKKLHALRHTFAMRLYRKTKDIRLVQRALGHRNILNTMIYADYIYGVEELRKLLA